MTNAAFTARLRKEIAEKLENIAIEIENAHSRRMYIATMDEDEIEESFGGLEGYEAADIESNRDFMKAWRELSKLDSKIRKGSKNATRCFQLLSMVVRMNKEYKETYAC